MVLSKVMMIRSITFASYPHTILARNIFPAAAAAIPVAQPTHRFLDTDANQQVYNDFISKLSPARRKMFTILNDYRTKNFTQCTNSRFLKTIIDAVDANHDDMITKDEFQALLKNIGAEEQMSEEDRDAIFEELGVGQDEKVIPVELVKKSWEPLMKVVIPK